MTLRVAFPLTNCGVTGAVTNIGNAPPREVLPLIDLFPKTPR